MIKMKRILIVIMILAYIYCTSESCMEEENTSKCQTHFIEISDMSCYLFEENNEKYCSIYPDNKNLQKLLKKYDIGFIKESFSFIEHDYDENGKKQFDIDKEIDKLNISFPEKDPIIKAIQLK